MDIICLRVSFAFVDDLTNCEKKENFFSSDALFLMEDSIQFAS